MSAVVKDVVDCFQIFCVMEMLLLRCSDKQDLDPAYIR